MFLKQRWVYLRQVENCNLVSATIHPCASLHKAIEGGCCYRGEGSWGNPKKEDFFFFLLSSSAIVTGHKSSPF